MSLLLGMHEFAEGQVLENLVT